ncbi:MAG: polysaccharide biosynthesis tyrosine autokinase [Planctomycetota bacterium]
MTANPLSTIPPIGPATGMSPSPNTSRFKPIDPVKLARQNYKLLIIASVIGLIAGVGLYVTLRLTSPEYTSDAKLVVDTRSLGGDVFNPETSVGALGNGTLDAAVAYMNNETNFIVSDEIIRDALLRPQAQSTAWYQSMDNAEAAKEMMQDEMLTATVIRKTTLIKVSMTAPSPDDARTLLQEVMATYLNRKKIINDQASTSLRRLFLGEGSRFGDDVRALKKQMERFIQDNDITSLSVNASEEQTVYNRLLEQDVSLKLAIESAKSSFASLQQSTGSAVMTDEENAYLKNLPQVSRREEELRGLDESRRQLLAGGVLEGHQTIKNLDRRRDTVEFELDKLREKEIGEYRSFQMQQAAKVVEAYTSQLATLEPQIAETANKLRDLTQKINEFEQLKDELNILREKQQRAETALDTLRTMSNRDDYVRVRRQSDPNDPDLTSPSIMLVPIVTLFVAGFVAAVVLLREMLDQRVRSPQDLKLMPDAHLLGQVPHSSEDPTGLSVAERTVERAPTGLLAESYRQIRTAVLSKMDRRGYKTLVCVSAQPEAGTSTVVHNLATSLAFNGRNVLIIDANFRRPSQHILMDRGNEHGLIDILKDEAEVDDVVLTHPDTSLSVLPTGHAVDSPPELLEGSAFRGLLGQLETLYDVILIDAPPALLTSDSQLLSKHVDAIAVVVQAGIDKRGMLGRMLNQLDGQRADVLGVILNGVKSAAGGYFRKSYEDFYRYRQADSFGGDRASAAGKPKKDKDDKESKNGKDLRREDLAQPAKIDTAAGEADFEMDIDLDLDDDDKL